MRLKKWICYFLAGLLLCGGLFAGFNALIDPFGIFGDKLLSWWSYDMTQNPRTAKIGWLDEHYEAYDSYIIGCSKTSSYPVSLLNEYYGANFYNMIMYGEDLYDVEKTIEYILGNFGAKNIVINTGLQDMTVFDIESDNMKGNLHAKVDRSNALLFYGKYLFSNPEYGASKLKTYFEDSYLQNENKVFDPETGAYDKSLRDVERISSLDEFLQKYPVFLEDRGHVDTLDAMDECLESVARIKAMCEEAGASFTYIISPLYETELDKYANEDLMEYYLRLVEITDFWDFSGYNSVAYEPRYFYDYAHFRNTVGTMALARMFNDDSVYVPGDFGIHVTEENITEHISSYFDKDKSLKTEERQVIVLMYHEIGNGDGDGYVSEENFRSQLAALKESGYESVTYDDLLSYVNGNAGLPEKPVVITFDDGYAGNLEIAAPILEDYGMTAVINVIGVSVGKSTYKDSERTIVPHFSFDEVLPWSQSGVISVQSHSYDMHQVEELDGSDYRIGVYQKAGESEEDYIKAVTDDFNKSKEAVEEALGTEVIAFAYPYGYYNDLTEVLLSRMGVEITVTSNYGCNTVVKGLPQTLRAMNRISVTNENDGESFIEYLRGFE